MKKIKAFFYVAYKSIISPKYYRELLKTNFDFSIKYYVVLILIAATITSVGTYLIEGPRAKRVVENVLSQIETSYPEDLIFTIKDGGWEVNKPLPLIFEFPKTEIKDGERFQQEPISKNLIVLDKNGTVEDLKKYDTIILVNESNVLIRKAGEPDVMPLKDMPDTTLDKAKVMAATGNARSLAGWILPMAIILFAFSGAVVYYTVFRGIYIVVVGAIIFGLGKLMKTGVDFKKAVRVGIHSMTLPILVDIGLSLANLGAVVPFWFMVLNLLIAFLALREMGKVKAVEPEETTN